MPLRTTADSLRGACGGDRSGEDANRAVLLSERLRPRALTCPPHSCNRDPIKAATKIVDQLPILQFNLDAFLAGAAYSFVCASLRDAHWAAAHTGRPLKHHVLGASFMGKTTGPVMVAFGHGMPDGLGVGPELPGCMGGCCWFCCCVGGPCATQRPRATRRTR